MLLLLCVRPAPGSSTGSRRPVRMPTELAVAQRPAARRSGGARVSSPPRSPDCSAPIVDTRVLIASATSIAPFRARHRRRARRGRRRGRRGRTAGRRSHSPLMMGTWRTRAERIIFHAVASRVSRLDDDERPRRHQLRDRRRRGSGRAGSASSAATAKRERVGGGEDAGERPVLDDRQDRKSCSASIRSQAALAAASATSITGHGDHDGRRRIARRRAPRRRRAATGCRPGCSVDHRQVADAAALHQRGRGLDRLASARRRSAGGS